MKRMIIKPLVLFFYVLLFLFPVYAQQLNNEKATTVKESVDKTQNPFEKEILAFEHQDSLQFPPSQAILFVGSSSIRLWKTLADDFPE